MNFNTVYNIRTAALLTIIYLLFLVPKGFASEFVLDKDSSFHSILFLDYDGKAGDGRCNPGDFTSSNGTTNPVEYSKCNNPQIGFGNTGLIYSWSPQIGLSCYNCPNPTLLQSAINNGTIPATYEILVYASIEDQQKGNYCSRIKIDTQQRDCKEGESPCNPGEFMSSNGTTKPVEYSLCNNPQIGFQNAGLIYSWSPQVGLTCYDCPNPTLLQSEIHNNTIPAAYEVQVYVSSDDQAKGKYCVRYMIETRRTDCKEGESPCNPGRLIASNEDNPIEDQGGTFPVSYSPCSAPTLQFENAGLFYSWSPQVGLSCYYCPNPTVLQSDIDNGLVPEGYEVWVYLTESEMMKGGKPCNIYKIRMTKKDCEGGGCDPGKFGSSNGTNGPVEYSSCDAPQMEYENGSLYYSWSPQIGLSCYECPNPTLLQSAIDNGTIPDVYVVRIYASIEDRKNENPCKIDHIQMKKRPCEGGGDPVCNPGKLTSSNGTYPVQYSPCDIPQLSYSDPSLLYSWSPQVGLSCYDCPNPTLLLADIENNTIPAVYTVVMYASALDREQNRPCHTEEISMLKRFCGKECRYDLVISGNNGPDVCEGDVIALTGSGSGLSFVWTSSLGGLSCESCPQTFYTVQPGTTLLTIAVYNSEGQQCGERSAEVTPLNNCFTTTGMSYNNYGVNTHVMKSSASDTYLNIYGNVINEVVTDASNVLVKGTFTNTSHIWVSKDWVNNGLNGMFTNYQSEGFSVLMGGYQRIRGNSPTKFHILALGGQGKKEQFVDAHVHKFLHLSVNELATRNNTMYVEDPDVNAIARMTGFVSSNLVGGGLSRKMNSLQTYSFPVGSAIGTMRYRPVDVKMEDAAIRTMKIRMVNYNPAYDNLTDLAPDVASINSKFYHQLTPSDNQDTYDLTFHYNESQDGTYQHIAQYESQITPEYWQKTGAITLGTSTQTPNTKFVTTTWNHFISENYSLANAGFVIDWGDFGNPDGGTSGGSGGTGVVVTVTGPPGSNGGNIGNTFPVGDEGNSTGVFTPSPIEGTYTIEIDGGECVTSGSILFDVDAGGNIVEGSIYFVSNNVQQPLAESLYNLNSTSQFGNNGIFDLNSVPDPLFPDCTDDVKIQLSNGIALTPGAPFVVDVSTGSELQVAEIIISNSTGIVANVLANNTWQSQLTDPQGLYKYELHLLNTTTSSTIILKGQFILTN